MAARQDQDQEQKLVDRWNAFHNIGDPVIVRRDDGTETRTKTLSHACVLGGHTAVIWLEGIRSCYALSRVRPADPVETP